MFFIRNLRAKRVPYHYLYSHRNDLPWNLKIFSFHPFSITFLVTKCVLLFLQRTRKGLSAYLHAMHWTVKRDLRNLVLGLVIQPDAKLVNPVVTILLLCLWILMPATHPKTVVSFCLTYLTKLGFRFPFPRCCTYASFSAPFFRAPSSCIIKFGS